MSELVKVLLKNKSAFAAMAKSAYWALWATLFATVVDLGWLFGDMAVHLQPHHIWVAIGLILGIVGQSVALHMFHRAIQIYNTNHNKKVKEKRSNKYKVSKQSEVIMHLNQRITELEHELDNRGNV